MRHGRGRGERDDGSRDQVRHLRRDKNRGCLLPLVHPHLAPAGSTHPRRKRDDNLVRLPLGALCRLNSWWITSEASSSADIGPASTRSEDFKLSISDLEGAYLPDRILSARFNRSRGAIVTRICPTLLTTTGRYFPDELSQWPQYLK